MNQSRNRKLNKSEKGFTLVELLVSITILAIIVVPVLTAFISSANANSRAKRKLEATTAAQNVMENIKAVGVKAYLDSLKIGTAESGYTYAAPDAQGIYTLDNSSETAAGVLVPQQVINNRSFRFKAVFSPAAFSNESGTGYNDASLANIDNMNVLQDAFYVSGEDADQKIVDEYFSMPNITNTYTTETAIINALSREIDITILHTGDEDTGITKVRVDCIYKLDNNAATTKTVSSTVYDNSDIVNGKLRSVYLFYTPLYAIKNAAAKDTIKVFNNTTSSETKPSSISAKVYLVKQRTTDAQEVFESTYKVNLEVDEINPDQPVAWSPPDDYRAFTTILTNIGTNMLTDLKTEQFDSILFKSGSQSLNLIEKNKKYLGITTMEDASKVTRLYQITIDVFTEGSEESVYTMTGTADT